MDYQLTNRSAFVSGSTAGIGLAVATVLAREGASVTINGRSEESIDTARGKILKAVPQAKLSGFVADFSDPDSIKSRLDQLSDIDILINNVGIFTSQNFPETPDEDWYRLFEVNVMSGVRLTRALLPQMLSNNWGRIIFVSSECAALVPEDLIAYSMTKAAILAIARGLAQTTRGSSVTVNTILPGSTLSEGAERFLEEQAQKEGKSVQEVSADFFQNVRTSSIIQRFISTDEIAHLIAYISSPLSAATNGAALRADGGSIPGII